MKEKIRKALLLAVEDVLCHDPAMINDALTLDELGADSLDVVEIIMYLEEDLDVDLGMCEPGELISGSSTIAGTVDAVEKYLQEAGECASIS